MFLARKFLGRVSGLIAFAASLQGCGGDTTPAPAPTVPADTTTFNVSAPKAPSSYTINGVENPALTLQRGKTYTFNLSVSGHPFYIMSAQGTDVSKAFSSGVTGNGGQSGTLTFAVPAGAPGTLFYDCSIHSGMTGTITVTN